MSTSRKSAARTCRSRIRSPLAKLLAGTSTTTTESSSGLRTLITPSPIVNVPRTGSTPNRARVLNRIVDLSGSMR
ncbi:hypothetical protein OIE67_19400 [Nonomuraea fuscirosea]|nr:hypothetical protein [Nonomuraea fuscirosea]WSA56696.1 hypothetical protein OIE67_19400 [Nonomuraea fuscirosea]